MNSREQPPSIPSKAELLEYIESQPHPVSRRELARAFKIKGSQRIPMKSILKELMTEGKLIRQGGLLHKTEISPVNVVEITGQNRQGLPIARPLHWSGKGKAPQIALNGFLKARTRRLPTLNKGDRVLAKLEKRGKERYEGRIIHIIAQPQSRRLVGKFVKTSRGGLIEPSTLQFKSAVMVASDCLNQAQAGDIVVAELQSKHGHRHGTAHIRHNLGSINDPRTTSKIAIYEHELPHKFSTEAIQQAEQACLPELKGRQDLRQIPLVTIDGEDARDFDDAVWAEPDPNNPGGWHALVAIADVSFYVRPEDSIDLEARERGNSVYFPDRVVPMIPEALSNEMCSLKPNVDRACLAVHMWFDAQGNRRSHKFVRGIMRSVARLTYSKVQHAHETQEAELAPYLAPLFGVFKALRLARQRRGALDFERVETRILVDEKTQIQEVRQRPSLDSHKLIEELMIAANVTAAITLGQNQLPCMYRIHDEPDALKLSDVLPFLKRAGIKISKGSLQSAAALNSMLKQSASTPWAPMVNELLLRTMAKAQYNPKNIGHYGLQLKQYCHFTSPIRRYADLLVHRCLVKHIESDPEQISSDSWSELGGQLSETERKADKASRTTNDRFMARYLKDRVGDNFKARISSVTKFGLFITEESTGADGLIHIATLPNDYYIYEPRRHQLIGRQTRRQFTLGDKLTVQLEKTDELTGKLEFGLVY